MSSSLADLERVFYCAALGLTPLQVANLSPNDLETLFLAAQASGTGFMPAPATPGAGKVLTVTSINPLVLSWQTPGAGSAPRTPASATSMAPTGITIETFPRAFGAAAPATGTAPGSGVLKLQAIDLPLAQIVSNIIFALGSTAAAGLTNWWYALYDSAFNMLAVTANQLAATPSASALSILPVAATAAGAAANFTTTYAGRHYLGYMFAGTTPPGVVASGGTGGYTSLVPIIGASSDTGQTTIPAFPHVAGTVSGEGLLKYGGIS